MPNLTCRASWLLPLLLCLLNDTQIGPSPPLFPVLPCLCPFPGSPPPPHPIPGQSIVCFAPCSVPYSIYWNEEGIILLPFSYREETTQHPLKYFIFQYQYASEKKYDCQPENKMCLKFGSSRCYHPLHHYLPRPCMCQGCWRCPAVKPWTGCALLKAFCAVEETGRSPSPWWAEPACPSDDDAYDCCWGWWGTAGTPPSSWLGCHSEAQWDKQLAINVSCYIKESNCNKYNYVVDIEVGTFEMSQLKKKAAGTSWGSTAATMDLLVSSQPFLYLIKSAEKCVLIPPVWH